MKGTVYSVDFGDDFAAHTIEMMEAEFIKNGYDWPDITLWVPSSRSARMFKDAFTRQKGQASLLPTIMPLNISEDFEDYFAFEDEGSERVTSVSQLEKLLVLTRLVQARDNTMSPARALENAESLAAVFDTLTRFNITVEDLEKLVVGDMADHWQANLEFIKIALHFYPQWLQEKGLKDPELAQAERLYSVAAMYRKGYKKPVVAAGFSDTVPAGVEVLKAITEMENGRLVLAGFEPAQEDDNLPAAHPLTPICNLLEKCGVNHSNVLKISSKKEGGAWQNIFLNNNVKKYIYNNDVKGIISSESPQQEAEAIALIIKRILATTDEQVALVSADRMLAARVAGVLATLGVNVDDSAGQPLNHWPAGQVFELINTVMNQRFAQLSLAMLIKHPLAHFGYKKAAWKKRAYALELLCLRGQYADKGIAGLRKVLAALQASPNPYKPIDAEQFKLAQQALQAVEFVFAPLANTNSYTSQKPMDSWLEGHLKVFERLCSQTHFAEDGTPLENANSLTEEDFPALNGEDGDALVSFVTGLRQHIQAQDEHQQVKFVDYAAVVAHLLSRQMVRHQRNLHPRAFIWGPLEARLQKVDNIILAGMNEGKWPKEPKPDPWLNRAMKEELGLPPMTLRLALSAHDFTHLLSQKNVYITHCLYEESGEETVPSRFLSRMEKALGEETYKKLVKKGEQWLEMTTALRRYIDQDIPIASQAVAQPPVNDRPTVWSASYIKNLLQCPYKSYLEKTLRLEKMEDLQASPDAAEKGDIIHTCLEAFFDQVEGLPKPYDSPIKPDNRHAMRQKLIEIGQMAFQPLPKVTRALWWPRFELLADQFVDKMIELTAQGRKVEKTEIKGDVKTGKIQLHARVDRLDVSRGSATIIDYKTGQTPSVGDVEQGLEPQLVIGALLAEKGGFGQQYTAEGMEYWALNEPHKGIKIEAYPKTRKNNKSLEQLLNEAEEGLERLQTHFLDAEAPLPAVPGEDKQCRHCDFAGICRRKEWQNQTEQRGPHEFKP